MWISARRRTILVFHDPGKGDGADTGLERLAVSRYSVGESFEAAWDPETQPDQWARLVEIIEERSIERSERATGPSATARRTRSS